MPKAHVVGSSPDQTQAGRIGGRALRVRTKRGVGGMSEGEAQSNTKWIAVPDRDWTQSFPGILSAFPSQKHGIGCGNGGLLS